MSLQIRSVIDALRSEIQSQILKGAIPPGTALTELSLAQHFDVARPTAKAAIEQLVSIGLLRRLPNKTARVPLLDAADIADLYLSRGVIERAVIRLLAERGEVPLAQCGRSTVFALPSRTTARLPSSSNTTSSSIAP